VEVHADPTPSEDDPLELESQALFPALSAGECDSPSGGNDPVPREIVSALQRPDGEAGRSRKPGSCRNPPVRNDPTARDASDNTSQPSECGQASPLTGTWQGALRVALPVGRDHPSAPVEGGPVESYLHMADPRLHSFTKGPGHASGPARRQMVGIGNAARSWHSAGSVRHPSRRGVSDMVATILIVMVTVVLAAVLYILIAGLSHSAGAAPLGSAFTWGAPVNATGVPTYGCAATTHYCYRVDIAWTAGSFQMSSLGLSLSTPMATPVGWPTSVAAPGGTVKLVSSISAMAVANYWVSNGSWQPISGFGGTIGSGFSIVIYGGGAAESSGQGLSGLELVGVGSSGYSGTVASAPFS